jgi:hypothetical protein
MMIAAFKDTTLWKATSFEASQNTIELVPIYLAQLSRFYLKTEMESSLRNVVF